MFPIKKNLKEFWKNIFNQWLAPAVRVFTKVHQPPFTWLLKATSATKQ